MGIQEIILIALVLLVLFGAKRIPGMMKNIGKGISEFNSEKNSKHSSDNDQSEND
jgi:sec-independent protein translocase protein TatA